MFDRGWDQDRLKEEIFQRKAVLAYLIENGLNTYTQVAATLQAFMNDQETILGLLAGDQLERSLEDLREMESVEIDIDPEKEEMVPRPDATEEMLDETGETLREAEEMLRGYQGSGSADLASALDLPADAGGEPAAADGGESDDLDFGGFAFDGDDEDEDEAGGEPE